MFEHSVRSVDADIMFRSSDGVLFRVHKTNLQACTEGFSPPEASDFGEVVELTETASILEVLFQFIYPMPQPRLESFSSTEIASLAEAAEKYQVHPAMGACRIYMKYSQILPLLFLLTVRISEIQSLKTRSTFWHTQRDTPIQMSHRWLPHMSLTAQWTRL